MNQKTQQEGYRNFNLKSLTEAEERFIKKLVDFKEENFSFMEKESHNTIKNSMEQLKQ